MFFSKEFSTIQNNIINLITVEDRPMTARELAKQSNVTYQTIKNHLMPLLAKGVILEAGKGGVNNNAMRYELGNPADSLIQIIWRGQPITIAKLMTDLASGETPVAELKGNEREIVIMFCKLYLASAKYIEDAHQTISINDMKRFQSNIATRRSALKELLKTYDSMLEQTNLWDPREIITELMIRDKEMSTEKARSIHGNIIPVLEG